MHEDGFWSIIEAAGAPDVCPVEQQCDAIVAALSELSKEELVAFENTRQQLLARAYTWRMLKACFLVLSYVSDDVFEDFRHWVILNGKDRFHRTLANPNCMIEYMQAKEPIEEINGEPLMMACEEAWDGDIEEIEEEVVIPETPQISEEWPTK